MREAKEKEMIKTNEEKIGLKVRCWKCEQVFEVRAALEDIQAWQDGALVQDAMPYLDAGKRELLISRTCNVCFDELFGGEDE
jgi:hypothetical protein